jgi:hypothetical protein
MLLVPCCLTCVGSDNSVAVVSLIVKLKDRRIFPQKNLPTSLLDKIDFFPALRNDFHKKKR